MGKTFLGTYHGYNKCQDEDNPQGKALYLALFGTYVLNHCNVWFEDEDKVEFFGNEPSYKHCIFSCKDEMLSYAREHNVTIREFIDIDHPLAHGLPDTRSIH